MLRMTSLIAVAVATAGAAHAAGPTETAPDAIVAPIASPVMIDRSGDWSGAYGGIQLGYGSGDYATGRDDDSDGNDDEFEADGVIGGLHVGYLWDFGNWVMGPELQYDAANLEADNGSGTGTFDEIARLNLRIGRDLGQGLLYGSVGVAYANFDGDTGSLAGDVDDNGYVVGIGYDYKLNQSWTVGGQYQHHMFDDFGSAGSDFDFGTAQLRASYNF